MVTVQVMPGLELLFVMNSGAGTCEYHASARVVYLSAHARGMRDARVTGSTVCRAVPGGARLRGISVDAIFIAAVIAIAVHVQQCHIQGYIECIHVHLISSVNDPVPGEFP